MMGWIAGLLGGIYNYDYDNDNDDKKQVHVMVISLELCDGQV